MKTDRRTMLLISATACVPAMKVRATYPGTYYTTANNLTFPPSNWTTKALKYGF